MLMNGVSGREFPPSNPVDLLGLALEKAIKWWETNITEVTEKMIPLLEKMVELGKKAESMLAEREAKKKEV